jgi:sugar O-acyltransferase (sialic acid O-acetyltransferase NeuD family)
MNASNLLLVGAGGHAKVVLDALLLAGISIDTIQVSDDDPAKAGMPLLDLFVLYPGIPREFVPATFHVCVGHCLIRHRIFETLLSAGAQPLSVIHPNTSISNFAAVGAGSFIAARAVIAPSAQIGRSCIVNHGAIVDHDCVIGDFCHIAPNATLGGGVRVEEDVLIGAGATILPGVRIGRRAIIGAGAVLTRDALPYTTYAGVPARQGNREQP